jgi:transaldolase/glucose-6-phosphate isomerase
MSNPLVRLQEQGQSVWLDYIRRGLITSGELGRMARDGLIRGVTSNPTIFRNAITGSSDYDEHIRHIAGHGETRPYEAFLALGGEDIRLAADVLRPLYDGTGGGDGFVSFEAQEGRTEQIVAEAQRMSGLVRRPNLLIKVPGTPEGIAAVPPLMASGINLNVTLLFDVDVYERVALAYIEGLERRLEAGEPLTACAGVASFFVSRVDTKVDGMLPEGSPLRGKGAVANARRAYRRFKEIFSGERWERLAAAGARPQRPLWASTGTKNPAYSDVLYVEELIAPQTVNTMPEATLRAYLDHGRLATMDGRALEEAEITLDAIAAEGVDLKQVTAQLLDEGLKAFRDDFQKLLDSIAEALSRPPESPRVPHRAAIGPLGAGVNRRLAEMKEGRIAERIWAKDHAVWKPDPAEISNRLGWLDVVDQMLDQTGGLRSFAEDVSSQGYRTAVLLGMGGSSLGPEVLMSTFGSAPPALELRVLDSTHPAAVRRLEESIDPDRTLFIVASKSGTTTEALCHMEYFWQRRPDGAHFIAITDPGTPLEALARERKFRRTFLAPPEIGGRYSVLSYFGLVPAALIGADLDGLLDHAHEMVHACHHCVPEHENPGLWLGAVMGEAALAGRDKLTLVLPPGIAALGCWIEQLIAESTGKEGKGILPVDGEPLGEAGVYGNDRLFVSLGGNDWLAALEEAGHPVVRLPYNDRLDLGGEFFRWEMATAVAGHVLGINPFDQPNVQEAKDATNALLASGQTPKLPAGGLRALLAAVRENDYIAVHAYLPPGRENDERLQAARIALRDKHRVATTVGYGPRFLHSTGQLHKGGPNSGVFIQVVDEDPFDLEIPGKPYTYRTLIDAQALGDLQSLQARGRRVTTVTLDELEGGAQ